jgi:HK97 family phage prohead protease
MAITDKPWDGSAGRFTDQEYERSCVLDRKACGGDMADAPPKTRCSLPIKEPNGDLNRNGVHAAAGRIGSVTNACPEAISSAKASLRSAYKQLGETPPPSIGGGGNGKGDGNMKSDESLEILASQFGVVTGEPRHGNVAMRWMSGLEGMAIRDEESDRSDGTLGTLHGHFAVFNRWTEIDSFFEGRFMESISPGAFKKTFSENLKGMRCLFQHGRDPAIGMKPLGPIRELEEDDVGGRYDVGMLDTPYNRDLMPGLKANLYGASFRFQVIAEEVRTKPGISSYNPEGIEERKITEAKVREFGPVTFPAYADATAGVRSLNDWWLELDLEIFSRAHPDAYPVKLAEILSQLQGSTPARTAEEDGDGAGSVRTAAPPGESRDFLGSRSGAARSLRTSRSLEVPPWKL